MREPRRVRALSERGLVLCPCLSRSLPCFLRVLMILYIDKTLDEEDVLMIFDDLEVQNSHLQISFSKRRLLHNTSLSRSGPQRGSRLRYMKLTTIRIRAMT